jgi:hypothetical protein
MVKVTASALGASSAPTYVFVHPHIDSLIVKGVLLQGNGLPVQEPCLSQGQTMTVQAYAFSQGTDITASVGPFFWSARDSSVVTLAPLVNVAYNFATNQATAKAVTPGLTQIYASASGVSSSSFQQPQYTATINGSTQTSPVLNFFETCPIQDIQLELGEPGSNQTTFVTSKGVAQNVIATLTDVMGASSLPNTNGGIVLSKVPLTWTASQPRVIPAASTCSQSCSITSASPGAGTVTASCSPPTCNLGFPESPAVLSSAACTQFFQAQYPQIVSCQQFIPAPVYGSPMEIGSTAISTGAISGLITGTTAATSLLATSTGCASATPLDCTTSFYDISTARAVTGGESPSPNSPNSLLFDLPGDKAYMGSDFGAQVVNPSNFGGNSSPYTGIGSVTGRILAASNNGAFAVFSDTIHTPNQVYIVNTANGTPSVIALTISNTVAAAFSPDGLKTFIFGNGGSALYIYSPLQALQGPIALSGPANANTVAFSPNGAFAFVGAAAANGNSANLTAFANCNNQVATNNPVPPAIPTPAIVSLPANPILMRVLPGVHIGGRDSQGYTIPDGTHILVLDSTGFDILTSTLSPPSPGTLCPQGLTFVSGAPTLVQRIELGQGAIQPINFFSSADGTQLYVLAAGNAGVLIYDFSIGSVTSAIQLVGNATPLSADISIDAATIVIAGSDDMLHEVSTALGGRDLVQLPFPNLPNYLNAFCTFAPNQVPCTFNLLAVQP